MKDLNAELNERKRKSVKKIGKLQYKESKNG
jgi:hypothetical protein